MLSILHRDSAANAQEHKSSSSIVVSEPLDGRRGAALYKIEHSVCGAWSSIEQRAAKRMA